MANALDLEEQEQIDQLKHFWKRWGNLISWGLVLVLGGYAAWNGWQYWQRKTATQAAVLLDELDRAAQAGDAGKVQRVWADMQANVARTAQVYRRAIDDAVAGRPFDPERLLDLDHLANRGYTAGLLEPQPMDGYQSYHTGYSVGERSQFVAEAVDTAETVQAAPPDAVGQWVLLETKNRFAVGDTVEVVHPSGNHTVRLAALRDVHGQPVAVAQGSPVRVWAWLPLRVEGYRGAMLARLNEPADAAAAAPPKASIHASAG